MSGAVIDAISEDAPGRLLIADTFAGGGVIALAGLLRGHRVYAQDVNPWAAGSLSTMLTLPEPAALEQAAERLVDRVAPLLEEAYATTMSDGSPGEIAHTFRVATARCPRCQEMLKLFPSALVSLLNRVDCGGTSGFVACPAGHLNLAPADKRSRCSECSRYVKPATRYTAGRRATCASCGWTGKLSDLAGEAGFDWEAVLVDRVGESHREIGPPTESEARLATPDRWSPSRLLPEIGKGGEYEVLRRHGLKHWHDLYPPRQRVVTEALLEACEEASGEDERLYHALRAAVLGATEMAGYMSRWDPRYLKPYEAIANHRFNFTTFSAEPNVWGAAGVGRGTVERRLAQFAKASLWLQERVGRDLRVDGPLPSSSRRSKPSREVDALVVTGSSGRICLPKGSVDAVVTDPPYHDDVHYAELSDLFRAWAGEATGALDGDAIVSRTPDEGNDTDAYEALLTSVFNEIARVLRPGGHLVLSYANRHPHAWVALFNALQSAGFSAVGYSVVHSENETDHAKSGRRACTLDVLLDLVLACDTALEQHFPNLRVGGNEAEFCDLVGRWALGIGSLVDGWSEDFVADLRSTSFLS